MSETADTEDPAATATEGAPATAAQQPPAAEEPPVAEGRVEEKAKERLPSAIAEPELPATEDKPEKQQPFLASFSGADMRTLVVTVAGTLIANVFTVLVVASAVILVRYENRPIPVTSLTPRPLAKYVPLVEHGLLHKHHIVIIWGLVATIAFNTCVYAVTRQSIRMSTRKSHLRLADLYLRVSRVVILAIMIVELLTFVLVLLGEATGIK